VSRQRRSRPHTYAAALPHTLLPLIDALDYVLLFPLEPMLLADVLKHIIIVIIIVTQDKHSRSG
jgi:hypothetical protein